MIHLTYTGSKVWIPTHTFCNADVLVIKEKIKKMRSNYKNFDNDKKIKALRMFRTWLKNIRYIKKQLENKRG